jgi:CRP/FNR family transcriptional regulator, cyclic AMP receptor protein
MMLSENDRGYLLQHAALRHYRRGHLLFKRGDDGTCLFIVVKGEVEIFVEEGSSRAVIARKQAGDLFGELALVGDRARTASAATICESVLGTIQKSAFEQCISVRPQLFTTIISDIVGTIDELSLRLATVPLDAYRRLKFFLDGLVRETDRGAVLEGSWTHQQLSELIGCSRETVAKIMAALKRGQWIRHNKKQITILRPLPDTF